MTSYEEDEINDSLGYVTEENKRLSYFYKEKIGIDDEKYAAIL
jgi:hypothetical protein